MIRSRYLFPALILIAGATWLVIEVTTREPEPVAGPGNRPPAADGSAAKSSRRDESAAPKGGVRLDEPFDAKLYQVVLYEQQPAGDDGSRAYVRVPSTASRTKLSPNQIGEFPTQPVRLGETVAVRVDLPDSIPGTPVAVTILDGGTFPGAAADEASRLVKIESWGGVEFQFTASGNDGHHRVRVQPSGGRLKLLDFHASADLSSADF